MSKAAMTGWIIKKGDKIAYPDFFQQRDTAMAIFEDSQDCDWRTLYREGYRCVRGELRES